MIQSKQREMEWIDRDIISLQKKRADLQKQVSDKTSELYKYEQQLFREPERGTEKIA